MKKEKEIALKKKVARRLLNELVYTRITKSNLTSLIQNKLIDLYISNIWWAEVKSHDLLKDEDNRIDVSINCDDEYIDFSIYYFKTRYNKNIIFINNIVVD
jgi:hypothetical protein